MDDFSPDGEGSVVVNIQPGEYAYLAIEDLFGNMTCKELLYRVKPLPEMNLTIEYYEPEDNDVSEDNSNGIVVKGPWPNSIKTAPINLNNEESDDSVFSVDLFNNSYGMSFPQESALINDSGTDKMLLVKSELNYRLTVFANGEEFNANVEESGQESGSESNPIDSHHTFKIYPDVACGALPEEELTEGMEASLPLPWFPFGPYYSLMGGFGPNGLVGEEGNKSSYYCLKASSAFEEKYSYAYLAVDQIAPTFSYGIVSDPAENCTIVQKDDGTYSNCENLSISVTNIVDPITAEVPTSLPHKVSYFNGPCDSRTTVRYADSSFHRDSSSSHIISSGEYSESSFCVSVEDLFGNSASQTITFPEKVDLLNESAMSLTITNGNDFRVPSGLGGSEKKERMKISLLPSIQLEQT